MHDSSESTSITTIAVQINFFRYFFFLYCSWGYSIEAIYLFMKNPCWMYSSLLESLQWGTKTLVELRHYEKAHSLFWGKKCCEQKKKIGGCLTCREVTDRLETLAIFFANSPVCLVFHAVIWRTPALGPRSELLSVSVCHLPLFSPCQFLVSPKSYLCLRVCLESVTITSLI